MKAKTPVSETPRRLNLGTDKYTPLNVPSNTVVDVYLRNESSADIRVKIVGGGKDEYFTLNEFGTVGFERWLTSLKLTASTSDQFWAKATGAAGDILYFEIYEVFEEEEDEGDQPCMRQL